MKQKWMTMILALALLLWALPAWAEEPSATGETARAATGETAAPEETPAQPEEKTLRLETDGAQQADGDALFQEYLQRLMYPDRVPSTLSDWGEDTQYLNTTERQVYDALKSLCTKVADGQLTETDDWWIPVDATVQLEGRTEEEALLSVVDFNKVNEAAYWGWGYELYWRDTGAFPCEYLYEVSGDTLTLQGLRVSVVVSVDYRVQPDDLYQVNPEKTGAAQKAVENAWQIVDSYEGESDYQKLKGFLKTICDLVSYDDDGLEAGSYGDPWQLVYVFDEDSTTNVVSEGYAKAFQYLCDLAGIDCYLVTGNVTVGDEGPGVAHMWNHVILNGETYLVDPTNCDYGAAGMPDQLFLRGAERNADGSYDISTYVNGHGYKVNYAPTDYSEGGGLMDEPPFRLREQDYWSGRWEKAMMNLPEVVSYGDEFSQMLFGAAEEPAWNTSGCARVDGNGWVTITGIGDFSITATLPDGNSYTVSGTAIPRKVTPTAATAQNKSYDGSASVSVTDVSLEGVIQEGEVSVDLSQVTGTLPGAGAGHYDTLTLQGLKLTGSQASCYTIEDTAQVSTDVTVDKAAAPAVPDRTLSLQAGGDAPTSLSLAGWLPADAGTLTYTAGTAEDPAGLVQDWWVEADGTLHYTLARADTAGRVVLPVTVQSANYDPVTARVVLQITRKPAPTAPEESPAPTSAPGTEGPAPTAAPTPTGTLEPTALPTAAAQTRPAGQTIPQTGDASHPMVWVLLMFGAAAGAALVAYRRKRER